MVLLIRERSIQNAGIVFQRYASVGDRKIDIEKNYATG